MPLEAQAPARLVRDRWIRALSIISISASGKKKPGSRPLGPLPGCKPRRQALTRHVAIAHCYLAAVLSHVKNGVESIRAACAAYTFTHYTPPPFIEENSTTGSSARQ